jgi:hypothetical protein
MIIIGRSSNKYSDGPFQSTAVRAASESVPQDALQEVYIIVYLGLTRLTSTFNIKNKTHTIENLLAIDLHRAAGQDAMVILLFPTARYYRKAGNHQGTSASARPSSPITSLAQGVTEKPPSAVSQAGALELVANKISLSRIKDGKLDWGLDPFWK